MGKVGRGLRWGAQAFLCAALGLLSAGCGSSLVPPRQGLEMRDISYPMREMQFPSGLRVLAEQDSRQPLVGLVLVVGAGGSSDPAGKEGLAHYVEHLAFRSRPFGKSSFKRLLERAGAGQWNAFTGLDETVYFELGPKTSLSELLQLEGTRMLVPVAKLAPETLATELEVVRNELRQRNETGLSGEVFGSMQSMLFPKGHPYARPVIGTHESLTSFTGDDVAAFLKAYYRPDNMTLHIIGDLDLNTIDILVEQSLPPALLAVEGAAPAAKSRIPAIAPEPPTPPPASLVRKEGAVATPELFIGWSLPRAFDADAFIAEATEAAARNALAAATFTDEDIASVTTRLVPGKDASMLIAQVSLTRGSHPERSLEHVLDQVYRVWTTSLDVASVRKAEIQFVQQKKAAVVDMVLAAENILGRGIARATTTHFSGDPTMYSRALSGIVGLEQSKVLAYSEKYLSRARARAVLLVPPQAGGSIPASSVLTAPADEEDKIPIRVDLARLRNTAPPLGASDFIQFKLENGLEVILAPHHGLPLVATSLVIKGGYGGAQNRAAAAIALSVAQPKDRWHGFPADFGARFSRIATRELDRMSLVGAAGNTPIMIAILGEGMRSLSVDPVQWDGFLRDKKPYLQAREQKPQWIGKKAFRKALFADTPLGYTPTNAELENVSASDLNTVIEKSFAPQNALLVVVGEIDPVQIEAVVREQLSSWEKTDASPTRIPTLTPSEKAKDKPTLVVANRPGASQAELMYGCIVDPVDSMADDIRHDVTAQILTTRINHILREELGLTYGIHATALRITGGNAQIYIEGDVEQARLGAALSAIRSSLRALAEQPVGSNELGWAKLRLAQERGSRYMSNQDIMSAIIGQVVDGFPLHELDEYAPALDRVTPEQVLADLKACAAGNPTLLVVGNEAEARTAFEAAYTDKPAPEKTPATP